MLNLKQHAQGLKKRAHAYLDSHEFKVAFIRQHRKLSKVRKLIRSLVSDDPWMFLNLIGAHNKTYVTPRPNPSRQVVTVPLNADPFYDAQRDIDFQNGEIVNADAPFVPGMTEAYIVAKTNVPRVYPRELIKSRKPMVEPGPAELAALSQEYGLGEPAGDTTTTEEERAKLKDLWMTPPNVQDVFFPRKKD